MMIQDIREIREDFSEMKESQIRMEKDLKYHIKRTDMLEEVHAKSEAELNDKIQSINKRTKFLDHAKATGKAIVYMIGLCATILGIFIAVQKLQASELKNVQIKKPITLIKKRIEREIGCKVLVHSHWRSKSKNARVGGAINSYHLTGRAMDISASCISLKKLGLVAEKYATVIYYKSHIHIDNRKDKKCLIKFGKYFKYCKK